MLRLRNLSDRMTRSSGRRTRRHRTRFSVVPAQHLEVRNMLAGNVLAVLNAGDLVLTGDAQSNLVDVVIVNGDLVVRVGEAASAEHLRRVLQVVVELD